MVQSGVSGCLALTRLTVFLLLGRGWGRRGQLLWRRFLPCSAGGVLARPLCLMLIWLAALWRLTTSFHLARRATIAPRPSCGWEFLCSLSQSQLQGCWLLSGFFLAVGVLITTSCGCYRLYCKAPGELVGVGHMHVLAKKWRIDISLKSIFFFEWVVHIHFLMTDFNYRT